MVNRPEGITLRILITEKKIYKAKSIIFRDMEFQLPIDILYEQ